jgi:glyoxylase I family protein
MAICQEMLDMVKETESLQPSSTSPQTPGTQQTRATLEFHGVRYQVRDVARAVAFYTRELGFELERQQLPAFASVSCGALRIFLSGAGASGSRAMPDGQRQEPGGWNRVVLRVENLVSFIEALQRAGVRFRNPIESGPGGKQIQIEDPDGNPIELFEPAARGH